MWGFAVASDHASFANGMSIDFTSDTLEVAGNFVIKADNLWHHVVFTVAAPVSSVHARTMYLDGVLRRQRQQWGPIESGQHSLLRGQA